MLKYENKRKIKSKTLTDLPWWLISLSSSALRLSMNVCRITLEIKNMLIFVFVTVVNERVKMFIFVLVFVFVTAVHERVEDHKNMLILDFLTSKNGIIRLKISHTSTILM